MFITDDLLYQPTLTIDDYSDPFIFSTPEELKQYSYGDKDKNNYFLDLKGNKTNFKEIDSNYSAGYTLILHTKTNQQKWIMTSKLKQDSIDILFYDADAQFTPKTLVDL